ncbi:FXSXX-COOH protein [Streptomyces ipomoeae]|jgi:FXSXX-COOH protein|uniref:FXSXX-COOH protein n=2 Tax=Streptomyces ipomoeae TaxID=103232 RepID=L1KR79_9ACTN|nr:FxSxx-COOH cyclophane-containing RiPP peptide [Streptomyces ipomoeae]EKX63127.1 FXSXX-COOH protein [Streptomyces ipomoeae 91-03]MDX2700093.1 FxSxx-COOH protein [Streptomyces ipomoeae]MDX2827683.1 FxSxx-COOH protein [Streptomyces ipomoeae]MDX2841284.1 FxSxx-COOH protein [Streptomyces ipomoeae]MDX2880245.1 FxSxx-COOH protein [Streptomyces ipomoeae]
MNASLDPTAAQEGTPAAVGPERVSLVQLAARQGGAASPALTRVVSNGVERRGPGRVAVAAFQSSV